jgi:1,4-dihydroxy-6-naphthoate synthase
MPIPLGGIVVRRDLPEDLKIKISRVLKRSIEYAFEHPEASQNYVCTHAQEMETAVMQQHISLYVNNFTRSLGEEGRAAIACFLQTALDKGIIQRIYPNFFVY